MRSSMLLELGAVLLVLVAGVAQAEDAEPIVQEAPGVQAAVEPAPAEATDATADETAPMEPMEAPELASEPLETLPAEPASESEAQSGSLAAEAAPAEPAAPEAMEPQTTEPVPMQPAAAPAPEVADNGITLGQIGYDSEGRPGRIHVVVRGDTLWDISEAYLGTPWVWPSVWQDNRGIENPHLIYPGDRIWITDGEMRVVTKEEADALLAGAPPASEPEPEVEEYEEPEPIEEAEAPAPTPTTPVEVLTQRVSTRESVGFVTADDYESSASIVDSIPDKAMLSQEDRVYIGLGAGDVAKGDQFTVYRMRERVFDPDTGRLLGYHVDVLGWLEVEEPRAESSVAVISESISEMELGDRLTPREHLPPEIAVLPAPHGLEGKVSFFARSRTMMGMSDFVYLNRGTLDGVEVGSPLEVYRPAYVATETARGTRVEVPDRVIAQLLVVKAQPNTSVAFVTHTADEIELGDYVRGATD